MAKTPQAVLALLLLFHFVISVVLAGRNIPNTNIKKPDDMKHPETFLNHDRGYLIPGIGRGIKPKCKDGFNPFTYNPVTGGNNGIPGAVPSVGGVGGRSYVPGGDDTFVPNPGVEVPNPGSSSGPPGPGSP